MNLSNQFENTLEDSEIDLVLESVFRASGYDFRNYARASLKRRLEKIKWKWQVTHYSEMIPKIFHTPSFLKDLLQTMSISVTEMFRDPQYYLSLRENVIPILKTYPYLKLWNAGCSTGEEAYSTAILLEEEEVSSRIQIYATDFNDTVLNNAVKGEFDSNKLPEYSDNYKRAGGKRPFSNYYRAEENTVALNPRLKENILFTYHNLATDSSFGEMNMIICRNVMIYFDKTLQNRVLHMFMDSLCERGYLCLGTKESLEFSQVEEHFEMIDKDMKIYRKSPTELLAA